MKKINPIHIIGIISLIAIVFPIIYLLVQVFRPGQWALSHTLLYIYARNTLFMVLVVGAVIAILGALLAYIVSFYDFRFRKLIMVLLALPLAFPPYISAQIYADFTYSGGLFHKLFGVYFDMMNIYGAVFVYIMTLYPYVYLICLNFYSTTNTALLDSARLLGTNHKNLFLKIGLPIARIAIISGVVLAVMELISDFGVVDYYGVQAFSTGIYKTWLSYEDFYGAIRLSAMLLFLIFSLVILETLARRRLRFYATTKSAKTTLMIARKSQQIIIYTIVFIVSSLALFIPMIQLLYNASFVYKKVINVKLFEIIMSTFVIASITAVICVLISFIIANLTKRETKFTSALSRLATMGYSVPGVIIGLAVIFTFIDIDKLLLPLYKTVSIQKKLFLSTSVFILYFAYVVRFLAVSYNNIYSQYRKINPNLFRVSHTLGKNDFQTFMRVDLPLMMPSLLISGLLVFIEVIKELPITLMLKPYNVETLTGRVYMYVHNEQYTEASVPSLIIILLGIIALIITLRSHRSSRES